MSTALIIFIFSTIPLVSNTSPLLPSISIKNKKSRLFVIDQFPQNLQYNADQKNFKQQETTVSSAEVSYSDYDYDIQPLKDSQKKVMYVGNPLPSSELILPPKDSVVPKINGSYFNQIKAQKNTNNQNLEGAITNPAAYYLNGANLEKIKKLKCKTNCTGPVTNNIYLIEIKDKNKSCHKTFVPLNSCVDGLGYPVGILCTICCDCNKDYISQMTNSRSYKTAQK